MLPPPYVPLSTSANFTKYHSTPFGQEDQRKLVDLAKELATKGIPVILSNHDTAFTQNLYQGSSIISFDVPSLYFILFLSFLDSGQSLN